MLGAVQNSAWWHTNADFMTDFLRCENSIPAHVNMGNGAVECLSCTLTGGIRPEIDAARIRHFFQRFFRADAAAVCLSPNADGAGYVKAFGCLEKHQNGCNRVHVRNACHVLR